MPPLSRERKTFMKKILQLLEENFPNTLPQKPISEAELALRIGEQRVINFIKNQLEEETSIDDSILTALTGQ